MKINQNQVQNALHIPALNRGRRSDQVKHWPRYTKRWHESGIKEPTGLSIFLIFTVASNPRISKLKIFSIRGLPCIRSMVLKIQIYFTIYWTCNRLNCYRYSWNACYGEGTGYKVFSPSLLQKLNFGTFEESLSYRIKLFMLYRWIRKRRLCNFVYFCLHSQHVISCSHPAGPPIIHRQSCLKDREWLKWWLIIHDIIKPHLGSPGIDTLR